MSPKLAVVAALAATASAFPFVARHAGVNPALLRRQNTGPGSASQCVANPNVVPAAPITSQFPYNNATNGQKGTQSGGYPVPYPGDDSHAFIAPDYSVDIRGPCPGLNTAANHGFLSRSGVTTYNELVDAQQNLYSLSYEVAVLLAVLGIVTDGDPLTETLSIGCDTGSLGGLDTHNKFEADTSLTRNDYFTSGGNNFEMNGTLFQMMTETSGGNYSLDQLALYRAQRYNQSVAENPNFYFGPLSLLLYGAASFLYELMPGQGGSPDVATISSFFGAESDGNGGYTFNGMERIPEGWYARSGSYGSVLNEIEKMYFMYPVAFGGNTGDGSFDLMNFGIIKDGKIDPNVSATSLTCLIYQLATEGAPTGLNSVLSLPADALNFAVGKLAPAMENFGCPVPLLTK